MDNVIAYMMVLKNLDPVVRKKWSFTTLFVHLRGQMAIFHVWGLNFLKPIYSQLHYPYFGNVKMGC